MRRGSSGRPRRSAAGGFTLVELLVVITIIGVLVGLILPAVQAARESGRRTVCSNNVAQLTKACLAHDVRHGHLPTGGWSGGWVGEVSRGFDKNQPGGWIYNILPFLEETQLHDAKPVNELSANERDQTTMEERLKFPMEVLCCPSRRRPQEYANQRTYQGNLRVTAVAKTDYAACAGDNAVESECSDLGPRDHRHADQWTESNWNDLPGTAGYKLSDKPHPATGVIYRRSATKFASIRDGESFTYLLGEKYIDNRQYDAPSYPGDNDTWSVGYDYDVNRWTNLPPRMDTSYNRSDDAVGSFGSAHSAGFHMGFCDGSARLIDFTVDPEVHRHLGHKSDKQPTDLTAF